MILYVEWADAASEDTWVAKDDIKPGVHLIQTIGHFVAENKEALVIALNHDTTADSYSCIMHIPQGMIRKKYRIK